VSYILDALKKAAEQRDAQAPAMRRLFSPVPEFTESPRWRLATVGGAAAVAGAVIAVWALWPAPSIVIDKPASAPATARVQPEAPPALGAPVAEHCTAAACAAAHQETMAPRTPRLGGLVSPLRCHRLVRKRAVLERARASIVKYTTHASCRDDDARAAVDNPCRRR